MSTLWVAEPSPTTGLISGKASAIEVLSVQMLSSSSKEHVDFSGDEYDFSDLAAPPDISKYSHIFEEEMQVDVPATALLSEEVTTTEGISSIPLDHYLLV